MNIGICTFHYAHNYGAMLQSYAMKTYFEELGHRVVMVDKRSQPLTLWAPKPLKGLSFKELLLYPKYLYKWYLPVYMAKRKREACFEFFKRNYLMNIPYEETEKLDAIIYGSDQIWSKFDYGYDEVFWGLKNSNTQKRVSYAASMGVLHIEKKEDEDFIKEALSRFSAISVREKDLQEALINRGLANGLDVKIVIDPTFLLDKNDWIKLNPKRIVKEPYLLFYDFQLDKKTTEIASFIAKKKGLHLIRLTDGVVNVSNNKDYFVTAGPLEFVSLFYYADFVVSSSFHGTAFSIINEKQFYVRQVWNSSRVKNLLGLLDLGNRFVEDVKDVDTYDDIDYKEVRIMVQDKRKQAVDYLKEALPIQSAPCLSPT